MNNKTPKTLTIAATPGNFQALQAAYMAGNVRLSPDLRIVCDKDSANLIDTTDEAADGKTQD